MNKLCKCGCGQEIKILEHHKWVGIPNFIKGHNNIGRIVSDETKKKISMSEIGKFVSEETRKNISKAKKGIKPTKETLLKLSKIRKNKTYEEIYGDERAKIVKNNISKSHKGIKHTSKTIEKLRYISSQYVGPKAHNWQGGKSFEKYDKNFTKKIKKIIREKFDYLCQICFKGECEFKENLHIHHINYDKKDCSIKNLIPLCRKCHTKTHFDRKKWQHYFIDIINEEFYINQIWKEIREERKLYN